MDTKRIQLKPLIYGLLISFCAEFFTRLLTLKNMDNYKNMYRPPLSLPTWAFPVIWTVLFLFMGIAFYFVYISESKKKDMALFFYVLQLLVNVLWFVLFFALETYLFAFAWLILLWYLVCKMAKRFYAIEPLAGKLMYAYLAWITFLGYLNLMVALHYE